MVDLGFTDFRAYGYAKAFQTWTFGGPLEQNSLFAKRLEEKAGFWTSFGRSLGYKDVQAKALSQNSTVFYVTAQFERGEIFFRFVVYQGQGKYSITSIRWALDPDDLDGPPDPRSVPSSSK